MASGGITSDFMGEGMMSSLFEAVEGYQQGGSPKSPKIIDPEKVKKNVMKEINKFIQIDLKAFINKLKKEEQRIIDIKGTQVVGTRGASGMLVPVRVTAGEGIFTPGDTKKHYSTLAQINAGISRPLPEDVQMQGIFQGAPGVDTIKTMVPAGSFVMSDRGMKVLNQWDRDIKQASESSTSSHYRGGGIVETQAQQGGQIESREIGTININVTDSSGETTNIPLQGRPDDLRKLERALKRERLTRIQ